MKKFYAIIFSIFISLSVYPKGIKGRVLEKKDNKSIPLLGVNVYWAETTIGTITNSQGLFTIEYYGEKNEPLVFSYVGYQNDTIYVNKNSQITVYLSPGAELEEVTVSKRIGASNYSTLNPLYVQNVTGKELAKAACCNLSESFETNASVDVSYSDAVSGVKQIRLLGLSGRYSQINLENIPILRGAETAFGLEYIPGTWMESIQISKGTAAVKNGYESITGQINVRYKQPDGDEKLQVYTYGNQDGKIENNLSYSFKVNDKLHTSILTHVNSNLRELDMNDDGIKDKPTSGMATFLNRWNYQSEKLESKFGILYLNENRNGGQIKNSASITNNRYKINIDVEKILLFAKTGFFLNRPSTSIGTIVSYNYFDRESQYGNNKFDISQQNLYCNFIYQSYLIDTRHTYNLGLSTVYDNNNASYNYISDNVKYEEFTPGVFLEYNYIPSDNFTFLGGIRYDHSSIHGSFFTPRVHAKYHFPKISTLRLSVGKGYRTPNAVSENSNFLASSKSLIFIEDIKQEEAWNYGISIINKLELWKRELNLNVEFFRTAFQNQLVVDLYQDNREVYFYNLDGESYSNTFQIESTYELFNRFDLTAAYRINNVQVTYNGQLKKAPFVSKYKGLISGSYRTNLDKWQFNLTAQFHGDMQLPPTTGNESNNYRPDKSENYIFMLAQITKNYRNWSFYVGVENLTDYTQKNAIIDAQNPFGDEFDASRVWGPLYGRMFYAGLKYTLNKN